MSAPPKPWERPGVNNQNVNSSLTAPMSSSTVPDTLLPDTSHGVTTASPRAPPPVPNRPSQQRPSALGGYSSGLGGYGGYGGCSSYGGYSPYGGGYGGMYGSSYGSGYGGYGGYGMNRFGMNDNNPNSFARQAEDSSRQAFQSIESIVQAVGSVSMMLESSFYAVYNSFRAVVGVADHFSRMKMAFAQIFSAFAVIRSLRWLYRKLLVLLRLRPSGYEEEIWSEAAEAGLAAISESQVKGQGRSSWPIMLFFGIIIGGPWLIWRLLSSITGKKDGQEWFNGNDDHFRAVAEFDFQGDGDEELSFRRGQHITVAPKELQPRMRGWLLASVDGKKQGIIPANYVKVLGKRRGKRQQSRQTGNVPARGQAALPPAGSRDVPQRTGPDTALSSSNSVSDLEATYQSVFNHPSGTNASRALEETCDLGENMNIPTPAGSSPTETRSNDTFQTSTTYENNVNEKTASEILEKSESC